VVERCGEGPAQRAAMALQRGAMHEAQAILADALASAPDDPELHTVAMIVAIRTGDHAASLAHMARADLAGVDPANVLALSAQAKAALGDLEGAEADSSAALAHRPGDNALKTLAGIYQRRRMHAGRRPVENIVRLDFVRQRDAREERAKAELKAGRLRSGFELTKAIYDDQAAAARRAIFGTSAPLDGDAIPVAGRAPVPRWDGKSAPMMRLAVFGLPGLGDNLQFLRYVTVARRRVGHITLVMPAPLVPIIDAHAVFPFEQDAEALRDADAYARLTDVCAYCGYDYAALDMCSLRRGSAPARDFGPGFHIGLVWGGNPHNVEDKNRSIPVEALAPLAAVEGVTFHSLQVGTRAHETARAPVALIDHAPEIKHFGDTLAIIDALDLVISVETSVAHLAGSAFARLWVPLAFNPDWRWGDRGEMTPWYPSARLFRQPQPGGWAPVIERIAADLRRLVCETSRVEEHEA